MTRLAHFPSAKDVREEACAWVARIDAGLSQEDKKSLSAWLATSPSHAAALLQMSRLWDDMDIMAELADLFPLRQQQAKWYRSPVALAAFSAAFACAAVLLGWLLFGPISSENENGALTAEKFSTAVGEQLTVDLVDGTSLLLNTDSEIRVQYSDTYRKVILERGEVSFHVAHEPSRPFVVYVGDRVLEALGTIFNVELRANHDLEISVTEGRVRLSRTADGQSAGPVNALSYPSVVPERIVVAGEEVIAKDEGSTIRKLEPEDIDVELAWQRGMLIFRGETLDAVLREVSRYTTVEFELADDSLASVRVGGYFRAGDIDGLLVVLQKNFDIRATRSGDHITLAANQ
jgi:transmembrane sensor